MDFRPIRSEPRVKQQAFLSFTLTSRRKALFVQLYS
jgi:hypothetical protein